MTETSGSNESQQSAEDKAKAIDDRYEPGARPTVTLPGTNGTVAGTAFADYVDDEGNLRENADGSPEENGSDG